MLGLHCCLGFSLVAETWDCCPVAAAGFSLRGFSGCSAGATWCTGFRNGNTRAQRKGSCVAPGLQSRRPVVVGPGLQSRHPVVVGPGLQSRHPVVVGPGLQSRGPVVVGPGL